MISKVIASVLASTAALLSTPALAHHSGAMFDNSKEVSLSGTVKDFAYTNPHSWLQVVVPGADGSSATWSLEAEGPSTLLRAGIKRTSLQPGDKVTFTAHPLRDGRPGGAWITVTKADGVVLTSRPAPLGGVQAPTKAQ